jgi:3-methyladenine DNA glycosylase AlkD
MHSKTKITPAHIAIEIGRILRREGSAEHAKGVQWFFKEKIRSYGWYTADLRRLARQYRGSIHKQFGLEFLVRVADRLFSSCVLEEKVFAVLLLEGMTDHLGDPHFALFESWLDRIRSWADHDALVHYLIGPMMVSEPTRTTNIFQWARSPHRWHRRAACVALIQGARQRKFFPEIRRLANHLLKDEDDMVQKGLGWLLRESAKADPKHVVPFLLKIRGCASRLVLRTACEALSARARQQILLKQVQ